MGRQHVSSDTISPSLLHPTPHSLHTCIMKSAAAAYSRSTVVSRMRVMSALYTSASASSYRWIKPAVQP